MKARLIWTDSNKFALLLSSGAYIEAPSVSVLGTLLFNFKSLDGFGLGKNAPVWVNDYPSITAVPGSTVAYVTASLQLVIVDISPFLAVFEAVKATVPIEEVVTATEYAKMHNKSTEQVKQFCRGNRIWGAKKIGRDWIIPKDTPYPTDTRLRGNRSF